MKEPLLEVGKESNRRRSQRLLLQVGVIVRREGQTGEFTEETSTLVVNAHGALVALAAAAEPGQTLLLKNKSSGEEQACRVAYAGRPTDGKAQVGLEFIEPSPKFWHITFPPEDWASASSARRSPSV